MSEFLTESESFRIRLLTTQEALCGLVCNHLRDDFLDGNGGMSTDQILKFMSKYCFLLNEKSQDLVFEQFINNSFVIYNHLDYTSYLIEELKKIEGWINPDKWNELQEKLNLIHDEEVSQRLEEIDRFDYE